MTCPDDYNVIFMPFPGSILACVRFDADDYPTIYINEKLSPDAKKAALNHELSHIQHGDISNHVSLVDAERRAVRSEHIDFRGRAAWKIPESDLVQRDIAAFIIWNKAADQGDYEWEPIAMPDGAVWNVDLN